MLAAKARGQGSRPRLAAKAYDTSATYGTYEIYETYDTYATYVTHDIHDTHETHMNYETYETYEACQQGLPTRLADKACGQGL